VTEREIKLDLPGRFTLPALSLNGGPLDVAALPDQQLRATYFDTADLRMARQGVTLRYRTGEGETPRWTLKLPVASRGGELERDELTFEGARREPPTEVRSLVTAYARGEPLTAVATLRTRRRRIQLVADETPIAEVADDEVSVVEGRRVVSRFREIEVEARVDGVDLRAIGEQLRIAGATEAEPIPKVVRALGSRATAPSEIGPVPVTEDGRLADVVAASIADALTRIVRNDPQARLGYPEGVHQLRVAMRRLRSDLRTLGEAVDPRWREDIEPRLREIADAAADARDADVMSVRLRAELDGSTAVLAPLFETLERKRTAARDRLMVALDGPEYVALLNDLVAAIKDPPAGPADAEASGGLAPLVLGAWDRLQKRADELDVDSPNEDFHRARISVKRARYAAELAARSLPGKAADGAARLGDRLAILQDLLGDIQDAAVAEALVRDTLSARGAGARYAFEAGRLVERLRSRAHHSRGAFLDEWPEVRRRRWRKWAM
jgi:CHAD domain-containing protein